MYFLSLVIFPNGQNGVDLFLDTTHLLPSMKKGLGWAFLFFVFVISYLGKFSVF